MDLLNCLRISWLRDRKIAKRLLQRYQAKRSVRNLQWVCLKDPKQVKSPAKRSIRDRGGFSLSVKSSISETLRRFGPVGDAFLVGVMVLRLLSSAASRANVALVNRVSSAV